ncbi:hypothetical protein JCM14076_10100 [Methylosoma difficile]
MANNKNNSTPKLSALHCWPNLSICLARIFAVCKVSVVLIILLGFSQTSIALDILVLQSHDSQPYQQVLQGFKDNMAAQGLSPDYTVKNIREVNEDTVKSQVQAKPPALIFALGTPATHLALRCEQKIPILASLVLDVEEFRHNPNMAGIGLSFSADVQWYWLRRILPEAQQIAVIYDPSHGKGLLLELQKLAESGHVSLIPVPASNAEELPGLLQNLPAQLDAVWAVDGVAAFNTGTAVQELLLYSFRNRTPVIGLSAQWVKAGAIYALDWDYLDLGTQAADLASNLIKKGVKPNAIKAQYPRKVRPVFNEKTAEHMKLPTSPVLLQDMAEVLR